MEAICLISESCLGVGVFNFNILLQTSSSKSSSSLQKIKKSFQQVDTKCLRLALFTLIINTKQECDLSKSFYMHYMLVKQRINDSC